MQLLKLFFLLKKVNKGSFYFILYFAQPIFLRFLFQNVELINNDVLH